MSSLSKIAKRLFSPSVKSLIKADYLNSELKLTDDGKLALFHIVAEKFEDDFVKAAEARIADREAESKK